jgi:hypothetical protein
MESDILRHDRNDAHFRADDDALVELIAARSHEAHRALWRNEPAGAHKKTTSDPDWIAAHEGLEVCDLSLCAFDELPSEWKEESRHSARLAIREVARQIAHGVDNLEALCDAAAEAIHEEWRARHAGTAPGYQDRPYTLLSEGEKEKDRVIARIAFALFTEARSV